MKFATTLSRDEMKHIKAGVVTPDCEGQCLFCSTPGGFEAWYRSEDPGDATAACANIYPAYGGNVTGIYTDCGAGAENGQPGIPVHCN